MLNFLNKFTWLSSILNFPTSFLRNFSTSCQDFSLLGLSLYSNIRTQTSSWFCECLTLVSVPSFSSTLNVVLKCFILRNVFPVCRAVRSLHQQVFTTPANLLSGGESPFFYHRRLGKQLFPLFKFFWGVQIIHLLLNCYDKDQSLQVILKPICGVPGLTQSQVLPIKCIPYIIRELNVGEVNRNYCLGLFLIHTLALLIKFRLFKNSSA